nr:immunoglobulin heavy chain junction region [Mus musculus]
CARRNDYDEDFDYW